MDKPISLSMKDWLIRKLAPKLLVSEKTIEAVINHQFQSANEALAQNKTVEISGFGKFIFNDKKAVKKMETYEKIEKALVNIIANPQTGDAKRASAHVKLEGTRNNIRILKPRINEHQLLTDLRGLEEQFDSTSEDQGSHREDKQVQDTNL